MDSDGIGPPTPPPLDHPNAPRLCLNPQYSPCLASDDDLGLSPVVTDKPKKKQQKDSQRKIKKIQRISGHVQGPPCNCTILKCFEVVTPTERNNLIAIFNQLKSWDEQSNYLANLIGVRLKTRKTKNGGHQRRIYTYTYCVKFVRNQIPISIKVCHKAFISIFGITNRRTQTIKKSMSTHGNYLYYTLLSTTNSRLGLL